MRKGKDDGSRPSMDTSGSDSFGSSFDRSAYVVVRGDSQRRYRQSGPNDHRSNRRHCGSVGECQPELKGDGSISVENTRCNRLSTFNTLFGSHETFADFMDGSEFLARDNVFRHSFGRHQSADSFDMSQMKNVLHHLHTSVNAKEENKVTRKAGKVRASATGGPCMSPHATKGKKDDDETEPTTPSSSPPQSEEKESFKGRDDEKEMKHKKTSKAPKERKDRKRLPKSSPELDVFRNVIVVSSQKTGKALGLATDGSCMSSNVKKWEKEDHGMEPTTPSSSAPQSKEKESFKARGDEQEKKLKKASKTDKERKEHKHPPETPLSEVFVSDNETVVSSIGGLSQFPQPRRHSGHFIELPDRLQRPTSLHMYVSKPKSQLEVDISQPMSVTSSLGYGSVVQHDKIRARASRLGKDDLLPRPPTARHHLPSTPLCEIDVVAPTKVPLKSIFQTPREIDVSDPTIVSVLGASLL